MNNNEQLKERMTALYNKAVKGKMPIKNVIAQAVQLGIDYQTLKLKTGIDIVFNELSKK